MKIYVLEEMFWDDCDGHNIKLLDAYYDLDQANIERDLMAEQYGFEYDSHKRSYRVVGVNLK
jgi:hypothetical protein